jgi:hypothetical protein
MMTSGIPVSRVSSWNKRGGALAVRHGHGPRRRLDLPLLRPFLPLDLTV